MVGSEVVAKAPADGYTLLQIVTPHAINAALYSNLNFDFARDIAPVIPKKLSGWRVLDVAGGRVMV